MFKQNKQVISGEQSWHKPLRLWPGIVTVILQCLVMFVVPVFVPGAVMAGVFGGIIGGVIVVIWWAFFSRASRYERWGAIILMVVSIAAASRVLDKSIATGGQGMMYFIYVIPVMSIAFVAWAAATSRLADGLRRVTMVATILIASGVWILFRSNGITGDFKPDLKWRWAKTAEEKLLEQPGDRPVMLQSAKESIEEGAEWPGFRGTARDGIIHGVSIITDWSATPPVELWRYRIGPGCGSFAVHGGLIYTQEQRGDEELVSCYDIRSGRPVWTHSDSARFWDSHAGAGPRSTPTFSNGRIYTFGATGILNVLDAYDGTLVWSRNAAFDTDTKIPGWGFASSPLVVDSVVVVAVEGTLAAYDIAKGISRWFSHKGGYGYSSPNIFTIDGVPQILLMRGDTIISVAKENGKVIWQHQMTPGASIVQPALIDGSDLLISDGERSDMRRIAVVNGTGGWTVEDRWTSPGLKPYFNDFVVHKGYAFGFDGPNIVCIDIVNGSRKWRGARYGGQLILLADQDILLVLTEKGELALVKADPAKFTELARFPAIEGRTWNHPVLAGNILLIRNGMEMAAFRLSLAGI